MGNNERVQDVGKFVVKYDQALVRLACLNRQAEELREHLKVIDLLLARKLEAESTKRGFRVVTKGKCPTELEKKYLGEPWSYPGEEAVTDLLAETIEVEECVKRLEGQRDTLGLSVRIQPPRTDSSDDTP